MEDEGIIARDISSMVTQLGFEVSGVAGNGPEALASGGLVTADLVLMDIKIRGPIDGIETAEQIRQSHNIPVVFLTAHADSETLARATRAQAFGYIVKPFSEADLKVAIELALSRHAIHQDSSNQRSSLGFALQHIQDAVISTDLIGRISFLNQAAESLTECASADAVRLLLSEILPGWEARENAQTADLGHIFSSEMPFDLAGSFRRTSDGRRLDVVGSVQPVRAGKAAAVTGYLFLLRRLETETGPGKTPLNVLHSEEQLDELSYALSNELREPVRIISCFAELLGRRDHDVLDEAGRDYLRFIVEGSRRIERQMSALRRFQAAGGNEGEIAITADANQLCAEVVAALRSAIAEAEAQVLISELPVICIPPVKFKEIIFQLLDNSLKFRSDRACRFKSMRSERASVGGSRWRTTESASIRRRPVAFSNSSLVAI